MYFGKCFRDFQLDCIEVIRVFTIFWYITRNNIAS